MESSINPLPAGIASFEERRAQANAPRGGEELGRQQFLQLFTTQLQNQNPLDPVKNEAFVAQLAQFSQLEATLDMAESVRMMVESSNADRVLSGASLVGKLVAAPGGQFSLLDGQSAEGSVRLPSGADDLTVSVVAASGEVVRILPLGRQDPGSAKFQWDGNNDQGNALPPGPYRFQALVSAGNDSTNVPVVAAALVNAVRIDPERQTSQLELDGGRIVSITDIQRILN